MKKITIEEAFKKHYSICRCCKGQARPTTEKYEGRYIYVCNCGCRFPMIPTTKENIDNFKIFLKNNIAITSDGEMIKMYKKCTQEAINKHS